MISDAEKAMESALKAIPEKVAFEGNGEEVKRATEYIERQIQLVRKVAVNRQECLKREREYLFHAAKNNMAALKFKEIKLRDPARVDTVKEKGVYDPALTAYLLGELLRRAEAYPEAALWLDASLVFLEKELAALDSAGANIPKEDIENQRDRYLNLRASAQAQRMLFKSDGVAPEYVRTLVEAVLKEAGFSGLDVLKPAGGAGRAVSAPVPVKAVPAPVAANSNTGDTVPSGRIKTREQLLKMYYDALVKYRADKKANPDRLIDLVQAGYISQADSNLNENNKLICPETKGVLVYSRAWDPSKTTDPDIVLFPIKPDDLPKLFANGTISKGTAKR